MITYPYPRLLGHIPLLTTPQDYHRLCRSITAPRSMYLRIPAWEHPWWAIMPSFMLSQCPWCATVYTARVNPYGLEGWITGFDDIEIFTSPERIFRPRPEQRRNMHPYPHCPHWVGVHTFINFHGQRPPIRTGSRDGEVPLITPWLVNSPIPSCAVINAMPIYQIDGWTKQQRPSAKAQFQPSYTAFFLTYWSADPLAMWGDHWDRVAPNPPDPEWYPAYNADPYLGGVHPELYELSVWAEQGKLGWFELMDGNPLLHIGNGTELPFIYQNIEGSREKMTYR